MMKKKAEISRNQARSRGKAPLLRGRFLKNLSCVPLLRVAMASTDEEAGLTAGCWELQEASR